MTVSVAVNTTSPDVGTTIRVTCSGLTGSVPTAILLNGAGYVSAVLPAAPDGTVTCGRDVPEKVSSQILQVTQYIAGVWTNVGSPITLNVGGVVPPPVPSPATAPDPPVGLAGVAGDTVVDLAWSPPASDGGSAITGYQPYKDGSTLGSPVASTAKHVTGLTNGVANSYKVKAINAVGSSADSNTVSLTPAASAVSDWSGKPAFLSYASSAPISMNGQSGFTISAKKFVNQTGANVISIRLTNCSNFTITDCDFDGCTEPIEMENCTDFTVAWCRSRNIVGPYQRDGTHRGNFSQLGSCLRYRFHHIKVLGGNTEDIFSNYKSGGSDASHYSIYEDIAVDLLHQTQWTSPSGTGIILGDAQVGSYIWLRRATFLSPGQVGIAIVGGVGHKISDVDLYAAPRPGLVSPNVGMASNYSASITATISRVRAYWRTNSGNQNPYWWGSGTITDDGSNTWHATSLDPAAMAVTL